LEAGALPRVESHPGLSTGAIAAAARPAGGRLPRLSAGAIAAAAQTLVAAGAIAAGVAAAMVLWTKHLPLEAAVNVKFYLRSGAALEAQASRQG